MSPNTWRCTSVKMPKVTSKTGAQEKTPFTGTVFHTLSHDVFHFVVSGSFKNHWIEASDWLSNNFNQTEGVFRANTRNKTDHTMWKGIKNCVRQTTEKSPSIPLPYSHKKSRLFLPLYSLTLNGNIFFPAHIQKGQMNRSQIYAQLLAESFLFLKTVFPNQGEKFVISSRRRKKFR